MHPDVLGYIASTLTTLCWLPQGIKTLRTRDTQSLSLITQSAFTVGVVLWLFYGVLITNWPLILANIVTLTLVVPILEMKLRYG